MLLLLLLILGVPLKHEGGRLCTEGLESGRLCHVDEVCEWGTALLGVNLLRLLKGLLELKCLLLWFGMLELRRLLLGWSEAIVDLEIAERILQEL